MEIVTSLSRAELQQIITESLNKCLNDKLSALQPQVADRCGLKEAAEITGFSQGTIYKMTSAGKLPHTKFGNKLVFSRRLLADWMEKNTTTPIDRKEKIAKKQQESAIKKLEG